MTNLILIWVSLSLSAAICSIWRLYIPIISQLNEDHLLRRRKGFVLFLWVVVCTIAAPVILPAILFDDLRLDYIEGFVSGANEEE